MQDNRLDLESLTVDTFETVSTYSQQEEFSISYGTHCSTRATCELSWCWC